MATPPDDTSKHGRRKAVLLALALGLPIVAWLVFHEDTSPPPPGPAKPEPQVATSSAPDASVPAADPSADVVRSEAAAGKGHLRNSVVGDRLGAPKPGLTLFGKVTDKVSGKPVPYFTLWLVPAAQGDPVALANRGEQMHPNRNDAGSFIEKGLDPGRYNLLIRADGYEDFARFDVEVPVKEPPLDCAMSRGAYIEVSVLDEELDGLGDIEVHAEPVALDDPAGRAPRQRLNRTDAYGKVLFSNLPPGTYKVSLANRALTANPEQQVYVGAGAAMPVNFQIAPLNELTVRVKTIHGDPISGVHVRMWAEQKDAGTFHEETDSDGEAVLGYVPAGNYTLKLWRDGYLREDRQVQITTPRGESELELSMDEDPLAEKGGIEANPEAWTPEQKARLSQKERPSEVFKREPKSKAPLIPTQKPPSDG